MTEQFEPVIIGFTCNWCSYRAADMAGTARMKYAPNVRLIRLMCSGRLDPAFILKAFAGGADAVLVSGCHPGDCHYVEQNYKALRRYQLLKRLLIQMGIEPGRLKLLWASAAMFFVGVGTVLPAMLLVLLFWDGPRMLVLALLTASFLAVGAILAAVWRRKARSKPPLLASTLAELQRDRDALFGERADPP